MKLENIHKQHFDLKFCAFKATDLKCSEKKKKLQNKIIIHIIYMNPF